MSAVGSAIGGGVAGGAIGYAVAGRTGAVVGSAIGLVGGYNVEPLAEWYSGAVAAEREPRVATFRADRAVAGDRGAGDSAVANFGSPTVVTIDSATARRRLTESGYDPNAIVVPSRNGDPWGSFRVRRNLEWELQAVRALDTVSAVPRAIIGPFTLGLSELAYQAVRASNKEGIQRSIAIQPELAIMSPDYPPALWPYQKTIFGEVKVDTGKPFTDTLRDRMLELYGPTPDDVRAAATAGAYVANVVGKRVVLTRDERAARGIGVY